MGGGERAWILGLTAPTLYSSAAEYAFIARLVDVRKVDSHLNETSGLTTGCMNLTQLENLYSAASFSNSNPRKRTMRTQKDSGISECILPH